MKDPTTVAAISAVILALVALIGLIIPMYSRLGQVEAEIRRLDSEIQHLETEIRRLEERADERAPRDTGGISPLFRSPEFAFPHPGRRRDLYRTAAPRLRRTGPFPAEPGRHPDANACANPDLDAGPARRAAMTGRERQRARLRQMR